MKQHSVTTSPLLHTRTENIYKVRNLRRLFQLASWVAIAAATWQTTPETLHAKKPATASAAFSTPFPRDLTHWIPYAKNPVFTAEGAGHWDTKIRERGWILREGNLYHLWFTGYDGTREGLKRLGHATSSDGLRWTRSANNPLSGDHWVEDMMVVKHHDTYYMFAEGSENKYSIMLTSQDGENWKWEGRLDVRLTDGNKPVNEPVGTPTVWFENDTWYLMYERLDLGIWLAKTHDVESRIWTNVQDDPVLVPGPDAYDKQLIALNQVIKRDDMYYAFYHGSGESLPRTWNTNIARSTDLIHWQKYPGNPLIENNKSSGIIIPVGQHLRLYTMHDQVDVYEQGNPESK